MKEMSICALNLSQINFKYMKKKLQHKPHTCTELFLLITSNK